MYLAHFDHIEDHQHQQRQQQLSMDHHSHIHSSLHTRSVVTVDANTGSGDSENAVPRRPSTIDLDVLSNYVAFNADESPRPFRYHKRRQPSIDMSTCRRKLSLYGDNQTQIIPFEQSTEQFTCYYHPDTGCIRARSLVDLQQDGLDVHDLLTKDNYWIDISAPSISEMKMISKIFRIHPLTIEDILSQETREKCDVFRGYLFVCYRAFVHDGQLLKPVSFYNIIHKKSILSFHFSPIPQLERVYQRVEQLQNYMLVTSDWINYAILDEITDQFAPLIHQIEADVESIDDPAMLLQVNHDETEMVLRIGTCRKRVMQMHRLLGTKADVIRALIKRLEEIENKELPVVVLGHRRGGSTSSSLGYVKDTKTTATRRAGCDEKNNSDRIFPDVSLYLGDVQDHLITMLQNLSHYETVLARAHSNYLAQISIKLSQTSNSTNDVIGRLTVFATILMPMNLVTGLWGMNVKVPGKDYDDLLYFFWIVSSLAVFAIGAFTLARRFQFF
ncbi:hypothetical protein BX666DRAFT_1946722 [Dichotomocladium elegans]|nr:hypothetical protein BX666DRAFT_1946722 [Dichotomocladium elegans]